jgi:type I restriction enzyme S subunit
LCITIAANIAETAILGIDACFPDSVVGFIPNKQLCDLHYIFYYLRYVQQNIQQLAYGTVQDNINLDTLHNLLIPLPPLPTQRRIAEILGRLDDKIEVNRRINRTLEAMAQALFKHWFVDFGPFQDGPLVESELGLIPEGWRVCNLKQLFPKDKNCVITGPFGSNLHASDYRDKGVPLILVKHVDNGYVLENNMPLVGSHKLPELERYLLKEGDIVFTRVGVVGQSAYIHKRNVGWMISGQMLRVRVNNRNILNPRYLAQAFLTESFIKMVEAQAVGSTRPSLNTELLAKFKFIVPPIEVQNEFTRTALKLDRQVQNNLAENRSLTTTRDYLLPKLLSGEVAV